MNRNPFHFFQIPFLVMTFCYIRMFKEIKEHSIRMEKTSNQQPDMIFLQVISTLNQDTEHIQSYVVTKQGNLHILALNFDCIPEQGIYHSYQCKKSNQNLLPLNGYNNPFLVWSAICPQCLNHYSSGLIISTLPVSAAARPTH